MDQNKYIAFIGCSMTWGQGLYLPSWVDRKPNILREYKAREGDSIQWTMQQDYIDPYDLIIKDELSFTGIVSKELDRICVKKANNGGNNIESLSTVKSNVLLNVGREFKKFAFANKDLILIFQFTSFGRDEILKYLTEEEINSLMKYDIIYSADIIRDILNEKLRSYFLDIHNEIKRLSEANGFEFWYLDWLGDFCDYMPEKFIDIKAGKTSRKCFHRLVDAYPISVNFEGVEIRDNHLNSEGNKILAESILEWLRDKSRGVRG